MRMAAVVVLVLGLSITLIILGTCTSGLYTPPTTRPIVASAEGTIIDNTRAMITVTLQSSSSTIRNIGDPTYGGTTITVTNPLTGFGASVSLPDNTNLWGSTITAVDTVPVSVGGSDDVDHVRMTVTMSPDARGRLSAGSSISITLTVLDTETTDVFWQGGQTLNVTISGRDSVRLTALMEPPGRATEIQIREDGSALWVIENAIAPETTDEEVQLTILQFENSIKAKISELEAVVERGMKIKNFHADGPLEVLNAKVIKYEFEWENFAEVDDKYIRVGDVLEAGFLDLSATSDSLVIRYPASYAPREVVPAPDQTLDYGLAWSGPRSFSFGEPRITLRVVPSKLPAIAAASVVACTLVAAWYIWFKKVFNPLLKASKKRELGAG